MIARTPRDLKELAALVKLGEGRVLEFKRSTGELKEGMQTLCAFLNGSGGMVLFGIRPDGTAEGQQVTPQVAAVLAAATQDTKSREEIQKIARIKDREHFRKACLLPLLSAGWLERTIPGKPRSRQQRYRTTPLGKVVLGKVGVK